MWIVCFSGGLGNQMFQYAFYKTLCDIYPEVNIKADILFVLGLKEHNGYELEKIFDIKLQKCSKLRALLLADYCQTFKVKFPFLDFLYRVRRKCFGCKQSTIMQNKVTDYVPEILELNSNKSYIFMGNWINEKYFWQVADKVRSDFRFKPLTDEKNLSYKTLMNSTQSISIHVRRTDYLNFQFYHLTMQYYLQAIAIIEEKVKDATYFIFSDDEQYIKDNFSFLKNCYIISGNNGENSYKDMQLMSCCKHNIIANSTFSYWGAFLNSNPDKIVIEPTRISEELTFPRVCEGSICLECM